ncbi:hypothetical protein CEK28_05430 [Xenophilus sp. AP218F]|nr:NfeD family protein [Chromobacterium sp. ASV5]OWY40174.1 hypothetical protein CEK28_05430 [Xenophilus sp. AP218F]
MPQALSFWFICAALALIAEFLSGTFYLLVVAVAMAGGGLAAWLGLGLVPQLAIASVTGVAGVLGLRQRKRRLAANLPDRRDDDPDLGHPVEILRRTAPGRARVLYRGAEWDATLPDADEPDARQGYIAGRDGNTLKITYTQPE